MPLNSDKYQSSPFHIGIVGGIGPSAGVDLLNKIIANTLGASKDQDHLPVSIVSVPAAIPDRTEFLLGREKINPAYGLFQAAQSLASIGASIIGLPCNTAHAPIIFDELLALSNQYGLGIEFVHMINSTTAHIKKHYPTEKKIGLLATLGTYETGVYQNSLISAGLDIVLPTDSEKKIVHSVIYDEGFGIKGGGGPIYDKARHLLIEICCSLSAQGANVIIMGCTEIPLILGEKEFDHCPLIDPTQVLALNLIERSLQGNDRNGSA